LSLLYILDLIGIIAFAASGAWAGVCKKMDLFGVIVLGLVTAVGGGTLRDILLGDLPPFSLQNEVYLFLPIYVSLIVFAGQHKFVSIEKPLLYFDAVGLGTFVVIGTTKALTFEMGFLSAVLMGVMTGTAGGVIRDVLANQVPLILRKEIYASACIVGGILLVGLNRLGTPSEISALITASVVIIIRLMAIRYDWSLPKSWRTK